MILFIKENYSKEEFTQTENSKMKKNIMRYLIVAPMVLGLNCHAASLGDDDCESLLLVSSYDQNNVKIFDGCNGEFIRDLDDQGLISGAQGIIELPDGRILVASEKNEKLIAFDRETLSQGEVVVDDSTSGFIPTPLGLALDDSNDLYVASYSENTIVKIDIVTWQVTSTLLASDNDIIKGIDAGTVIDEGYLYAPGYDSDNVVKINLTTKEITEIVKSGADDLDRARGVAIYDDELFVTSEKTGHIKVFNKHSGVFIRSMRTNSLPAGVEVDGESHLLYNNRTGVYRMTLTGEDNGLYTPGSAQTLAGATFVHRLYKNIDEDQDGLTDLDETNLYGTDPKNADTDSDGMPDGWEVDNSLDPLINDSSLDTDEDGLSNILEFEKLTNPNSSDTDEDGENDLIDNLPLVPSTTPELSGEAAETVLQNESYLFKPSLNYPGKISQVSFAIENKPEWADFSTLTGELSGEVTNENVGDYQQILISATNEYESDELPAFSIQVVNVNDTPEQTTSIPSTVTTITVDEAISIDFTQYFSDIDAGDILTFTAIDLPDELALTEEGMLSGAVSQATELTFTITATDSEEASISKALSLSIVNAPVVEVNATTKSSSGGGSMFFMLFGLFGLYLYRS